MPYVFLIEACFTLPVLRVFISAPGCRPSVLAVATVLCALAPLLIGLRLLVTKKPVSAWWWLAVVVAAVAWVIPTQSSCVAPI